MKNFKNLQDFVDEVSEVLNCPITVEDANHRLLAYSKHDEHTDSARISTIIGRRVPENVINSLWKNAIIPTLLSSDQPLTIKEIPEVGLGNRIAISIRNNQDVLGFIWVLDQNENIDEKGLEYLVAANKVAKNLLLKTQTVKDKKQEDYQEIFRMFLNGHFKDQQTAITKLEQLGITPPATFSIIMIRFQHRITDSLSKQLIYLMETTQNLNIIFYRADEKDFIILVAPSTNQPTEKFQDYIKVFIKKIEERFFQIDDLQCGFGSICNKLSLLDACFKEAQTVLTLRTVFPRELSDIYGYNQLGLFQHIQTIAPSYRIPYPISTLVEYDRKNNKELLYTLETYLDCDLNINEAAKHLHIHANTLNYRLKRIAEIAQINFNNFNEKGALYLDLKLYKFTRGN